MLTGESRPVPKAPGDRAIGGSINDAGAITIQVTATGDATYAGTVVWDKFEKPRQDLRKTRQVRAAGKSSKPRPERMTKGASRQVYVQPDVQIAAPGTVPF